MTSPPGQGLFTGMLRALGFEPEITMAALKTMADGVTEIAADLAAIKRELARQDEKINMMYHNARGDTMQLLNQIASLREGKKTNEQADFDASLPPRAVGKKLEAGTAGWSGHDVEN